jgi:hypothetical protein
MKRRPSDLSMDELAVLGSQAATAAVAKAKASNVKVAGHEPKQRGRNVATSAKVARRAPSVRNNRQAAAS